MGIKGDSYALALAGAWPLASPSSGLE